MARLPQSFIDSLIDRLDIVEVIDHRVKLKKAGKNYSACCPFHNEKTPSFSVNPERQFYYCFGCGAGGNAIGFLMDFERLDFREAVEELAQTVGLEIPDTDNRTKSEPQNDQYKPLEETLEKTSKFYERALRQHPDRKKAVNYLKSRGLTGNIARDFQIGYAPQGWNNLLSADEPTETNQDLLIRSGMLIKNESGRVYDRFRDRVMFPIHDQKGRVVAFGGRVLGDEQPKYLNSPETLIFKKSRELYGLWQARKNTRQLDRIVVVEGYMDVIALAQHGIPYVVATLGTSTSETHIERLFRMVPEVVFCFDGDNAGRKAALRGLEATLPAMRDGRQTRFLFLPEGEDPDTLVRAKGRPYLEKLFDQATPLETFLFDHLAEGLDLGTMDGRARFSKLAAPLLNRIPEGVFKTLMYQELAERTGIDTEDLKRLQPQPTRLINDARKRAATPDSGFAARDARSPRTQANQREQYQQTLSADSRNPMHRLLGLLVLKPSLGVSIPDRLLDGIVTRDAELFSEVLNHISSNPNISTAVLLGFWFGTAEGDFLTALAGQETMEDDTGLDALAAALIIKLNNEPALKEAQRQFEALKRKPYADLTDTDKQSLLTLTQKIRALSGRN